MNRNDSHNYYNMNMNNNTLMNIRKEARKRRKR